MEDIDSFRVRLAELFDLPQAVVLNLPAISLAGNLSLEIENHRGIIKYTSDRLQIRIRRGKLVINGQDLVIDRLTEDKLRVLGNITEISFDL